MNTIIKMDSNLDSSPLGKPSYPSESYTPDLLFPISRAQQRGTLGIRGHTLPFVGEDLWRAHEISWLNPKGKPVVALGEFRFPADSPQLVESKSLKLYLNSFNQTAFPDADTVAGCITTDLSRASGSPVNVRLHAVSAATQRMTAALPGELIDTLDIGGFDYSHPKPTFLTVNNEAQAVSETLLSHLLKSNCLVTGQPDWGSLVIQYVGQAIDRAGLLRYLVSFRQHNEFHEHCVERIFNDLMTRCTPEQLSVWARYTRRGGLDINPWRSTHIRFGIPPQDATDSRQ